MWENANLETPEDALIYPFNSYYYSLSVSTFIENIDTSIRIVIENNKVVKVKCRRNNDLNIDLRTLKSFPILIFLKNGNRFALLDFRNP